MNGEDTTPKEEPQPERRRGADDPERLVRRARQARVAKVLVALALLVIVIIFVIANSQGVEVDFVFVTRHPPLIWIMLGCIVIGGIAGYFVGRPGKEFRRRRKRDRAEPAR
ncbi:MAG TPA: lipopolysaccharide assembly protein LapA domain-containing protein [Actinomycetota bacterium]|nr:lipopolysaccharide assembly protein LapA domain-containing protein [Actinomycetota bacterium]